MKLINDINIVLLKIKNTINEVLHKIIKFILHVCLVMLFINSIIAIIEFFENLINL